MHTEREFEVVLHDGRTAAIHGVDSDEETRIAEVLGMTGDVDPKVRQEMERRGCCAAWGAYADLDGQQQAIGLARYIRSDDERSADIEVRVAGAFRGVRLGKVLFETLILNALEHGLDVLVARVTRHNRVAQRLTQEASRIWMSGAYVHVEIPVNSGRRTLKMSAAVPKARRRVG
jgi:GNAT superfamily N-acetyltransferase